MNRNYECPKVARAWSDSRETHEAVAAAIHAIAGRNRTPEQMTGFPGAAGAPSHHPGVIPESALPPGRDYRIGTTPRQRVQRKPAHADPTTNFVGLCYEFDRLMAKLATLRSDHFDADADAVNWGDVGSLSHACERLAEVLAHYNREPNG